MVITVAVIAIGTSAYKSIEMVKVEAEETALAPLIFYHLGNGDYDRNQPVDSECEKSSTLPCKITYDKESDVEGIDSFERGTPSQPAGENSESTEKGVWM